MRRRFRLNYLLIALLALALAVGGCVGAYYLGDRMAFSAVWYGSGTEEDPYRIYDASQLFNLQEISASPRAEEYTAGKVFVLKNNVKLTRAAKESRYGFQGIFDGEGHTVSLPKGLLFYRLLGEAKVKDLNLKLDFGVTINERQVAGVAWGVAENATIENCHAEGEITVDIPVSKKYRYIPAECYCAPFAVLNSGLITGCSFTGSIRSVGTPQNSTYTKQYIGGIAARGGGLVENCEVHADIDIVPSGILTYIGGIMPDGGNRGCKFYGNLSAKIDPATGYSALASRRTRVYCLGTSPREGYFEGTLTLYPTAELDDFRTAMNGIVSGDCTIRATLYRQTPTGTLEEITLE